MVINANELTDTLDEIENELVNLDYVKTLLTQASYDVQHVFRNDGSKEEHEEEVKLIQRVPFIKNFIYVALDYVDKMTNDINEIVKHGYKLMGANV